jgi:hypothetical protein
VDDEEIGGGWSMFVPYRDEAADHDTKVMIGGC